MELRNFYVWIIIIIAIIIIIFIIGIFLYRKPRKLDPLYNLSFPRDHHRHKCKEERYLLSSELFQDEDKYQLELEVSITRRPNIKIALFDHNNGNIYTDVIRVPKVRTRNKITNFSGGNWIFYDSRHKRWEIKITTEMLSGYLEITPKSAYLVNNDNGYIRDDSVLYSYLDNDIRATLKYDEKILPLLGKGSFHHQWGKYSFSDPHIYSQGKYLCYIAYGNEYSYLASTDGLVSLIDMHEYDTVSIKNIEYHAIPMGNITNNSNIYLSIKDSHDGLTLPNVIQYI